MDESFVLSLGFEAMKVTAMIAAPMLIAAMVVGITISIFQAITQINEATLTFIPKMIAIVVVVIILAPWMIKTMQEYTSNVIKQSGEWVKR